MSAELVDDVMKCLGFKTRKELREYLEEKYGDLRLIDYSELASILLKEYVECINGGE